MKIKFVNLHREFSLYENEIISLFKKTASKGNYVLGDELNEFEKNVAAFLGVKYAIGVGNWTTGLSLVLKAYKFEKNDEIITVSHSFVATAGAIAYHGSKPTLVDIKYDYNIDENKITSKINKNTKAIMPVHLTGMPCEMDRILEICKKYNLILIEDAAQAFGSKYKGKNIGSLGDVGVFSLHPRKNFHVLGDGGLIVTNNSKINKKIRSLRNQGLIDRDKASYWGTNSRLDNVQASFANFFLKKIRKINSIHREIAEIYNSNLTDKVSKPLYDKNIVEPVFQNYAIRLKERNKLKNYLKYKGIETSIHYPIPIHKQKIFLEDYGKQSLPITEKVCSQILSLPIYHTLKKSEINFIITNINNFFKNEI